MLRYNPEERISAAEAIKHPYLATLHEPAFEPDGPEIPESEFLFDAGRPTIEELREELLNEVRHYHPYMRFTHNFATMLRPKSKSKPKESPEAKHDRVSQVMLESGAAATATAAASPSNGSASASTARARTSAQRSIVAARAVDRERTGWSVPDPNPRSDDSPDPR
jgi:hypothetical protein